ncbi:MAG: acyl carrier protein [Desulfobacteraceae bacterium]|nr:MAG: acyl carrier protein [Desulfobacteraceae bacterium]
MGNNSDNLTQVKQFIVENFLFGDGSDLQNHTSFLENGIIDSTGILELIAFLEATFGIKIEDTELVPENLDSLDNIAAFLKRKNGSGQTP